KEMIAVAVGGVNRRQVLSTRQNQIRQGARLLDCNGGVDEDSVPLPRNKSCRNRRPRPLFFAWGQIARDGRYAGRQEQVPAQGYFLSGTFGVGSTAVGLSVHRTGFSSDWPSRGGYESCAEGIRYELPS